jgi:hypothetical protein
VPIDASSDPYSTRPDFDPDLADAGKGAVDRPDLPEKVVEDEDPDLADAGKGAAVKELDVDDDPDAKIFEADLDDDLGTTGTALDDVDIDVGTKVDDDLDADVADGIPSKFGGLDDDDVDDDGIDKTDIDL